MFGDIEQNSSSKKSSTVKSFLQLDHFVDYVQRRFGAVFRHIPGEKVSLTDFGSFPLKGQWFIDHGHRIQFPLSGKGLDDGVYGSCEFEFSRTPSRGEVEQLQALVVGLLIPALSYVENNEYLLLNRQTFLEGESPGNGVPPNVLPLRRKNLDTPVLFRQPRDLDLVQMTPLVLTFSSTDAEERHRWALESHNLLRRWAFIPWSDLGVEDVKGARTIQNLGFITIWISDITQLTPLQQKLIWESYYFSSLDMRPLFLLGSPFDRTQLGQNPALESAFLRFSMKAFVNVEHQKVSSLARQQLYDLIFDAIATGS